MIILYRGTIKFFHARAQQNLLPILYTKLEILIQQFILQISTHIN